jgi:SpoVK/Ycf46/Vps4 family AAA+-type ATPase
MLLATLQGFTSYSLNKTTKDPCNMNLLFWGRPGTGKTEFAKYLAAELSMDLLIKRASDLLNCYVGETEASIRDAFDEARRQKALLFIDEADSFFTARESARHSWEITQTNELLTQMENHTGILICCTNLLHNLDRAAMRRFAWKIEFKPLTKKGKLTLYHKYFYRGDSNLTEQQQRCLTEIPNLTAGDFKTVWLKHRFYPPDKLDHDFIIKALLHVSRYKTASVSEKIGF